VRSELFLGRKSTQFSRFRDQNPNLKLLTRFSACFLLVWTYQVCIIGKTRPDLADFAIKIRIWSFYLVDGVIFPLCISNILSHSAALRNVLGTMGLAHCELGVFFEKKWVVHTKNPQIISRRKGLGPMVPDTFRKATLCLRVFDTCRENSYLQGTHRDDFRSIK
jgi:hypothetical protein